jgi:DNA-binding transcriptional LysR family regulator
MMLDWDDLRHFLAIARLGSLSAAARSLGVRQSTMGRRLAALESRTGAKLLQRTPRGYVLTPAGEAILGNVERIEGEALAVERVITGKDVRLEGNIRVTTVETLAAEILTPLFHAFQEAYPGVTLELVTDARTLSLTKREAEVALRLSRPTQPELVARHVTDLGVGLYAAQSYLDRYGQPDLAAGAPGHRRILVQDDLLHMPDIQWYQGLTAQADVILRSNSRFTQLAAAVDGMGLVCLMRYLGDTRPLIRLQPPTLPPLREIWMVVHQDIRHMPRIRAFTEFLTTALKQCVRQLNPA